MATFFGKQKAPSRAPSKEADSVVVGPSHIQSEFEKTFKTFVIKKDTQLAPVNWFLESKKRMGSPSFVRMDGEVIVIDKEDPGKAFDVDMYDVPANKVDVSHLSCQSRYLLHAVPQSCS